MYVPLCVFPHTIIMKMFFSLPLNISRTSGEINRQIHTKCPKRWRGLA